MSAREYNPLDHSIVQAAVGTWSRYECDDFVEALLDQILREIRRVHWNVFQHQWEATWYGDEIEDPEIPGILFVRFYQDRCDCGGLEPIHASDCLWALCRHDWNRRRIEAISDPIPGGFGRIVDFSRERQAAFEATDPPPLCTCGASEAWDENRGCLPTCIGQRANFQHEDVEFRWYKRPGRGMSTNKDWSADEWRAWHARCLATVRAFEGDLDSEANYDRRDRLSKDLRNRFPNAFRSERA